MLNDPTQPISGGYKAPEISERTFEYAPTEELVNNTVEPQQKKLTRVIGPVEESTSEATKSEE